MATLSKLAIHVGLRDVPKLDTFSESDPFVIMSIDGRRIGVTEIMMNCPNPDFTHTFVLPFTFNALQIVEFTAYDADSKDLSDTSKHDFIGTIRLTPSDIMHAPGMFLQLPLTQVRRGAPSIVISAEEQAESRSVLVLEASGSGAMKGCGLKFMKTMEGGIAVPVADAPPGKSVVLRSALGSLCNMDTERTVIIRSYKTVRQGTIKVIGEHSTTVARLMDVGAKAADGGKIKLDFFEPGTTGKKPRGAGALQVTSVRMEQVPTFVDYIQSGLQISLQVSVDFTGSNGSPTQQGSLHYYVPGMQNYPTQYHQVLDAVGRIMLQYDSDGLVPGFGFGAVIQYPGMVQQQAVTSHLFPLDPLNAQRSERLGIFRGVDELIQAYYNTITQVSFSGPTNFAPFLRRIREVAVRSHREMLQTNLNPQFHVGLILTDGAISDMQDTIDEIVELSALPVALIIVGVGNADFTKMDILDADDQPLYSRSGQKQYADIVQFVPYNRFMGNPVGLAAAVLEELPGIVLSYFQRNNITVIRPQTIPLPPPGCAQPQYTTPQQGYQYPPAMQQAPPQPQASQPPPPPPPPAQQQLPAFVV